MQCFLILFGSVFFLAARAIGPLISFAATPSSWDSILAKARTEGTVTVAGPGTADARRSLTKSFEDRYGIRVEYDGSRSSDQRTQIINQRAAGIYQNDVWITGFGTVEGLDVPTFFEPLEPLLLLADVKAAKTWLNGHLWHNAKDRRIFGHAARLFGGLAVNPQNVKTEVVKSFKDLLKPQYKGKIISDDARVAGVGQGFFTYLYMGKEFGFGPSFIKRFIEEQDLIFTRNSRQAADWIANGRYMFWPAPDTRPVAELQGKGVPIEHRCLENGQWLSMGSGGVGVFSKAPHPNAAVIYVNWLLSKEGQANYAEGGDTASRRVDVPAKISSCFVPMAGKNYFWVDSADALAMRKPGGELVQFLKSVYTKN
jgi:ABC-type Fe3+ transport system substrate-binding protein